MNPYSQPAIYDFYSQTLVPSLVGENTHFWKLNEFQLQEHKPTVKIKTEK